MATRDAPRLLTAEEFLRIDFGEQKAELDKGVIRMMAGGSRRHSRVSANIIGALIGLSRDSPCAPYDSNMAIKTGPSSIRYPDVSVLCGKGHEEHDADLTEDLPVVLFEVLSDGTARSDLRDKLPEYQMLDSLETMIFVDIATERVRVVQRTGPRGWTDDDHEEPYDVPLPALNVILPHLAIFAR